MRYLMMQRQQNPKCFSSFLSTLALARFGRLEAYESGDGARLRGRAGDRAGHTVEIKGQSEQRVPGHSRRSRAYYGDWSLWPAAGDQGVEHQP